MSKTSNPLNYPTITVDELRQWLDGKPAQATLDFGGLNFIRIKQRAPNHYQVVFHQTVYLDDAGNVVVDNH